MSNLLRIFDVFSRRPEALSKPTHDIPPTTRNRIFHWVNELYSNSRSDLATIGKGNYVGEFWNEIRLRLMYRTGRAEIGNSRDGRDAIDYVLKCRGKEFLDFLEDIFSAKTLFHVSIADDKLVDEVNGLLRLDNLPYHLTGFLTETVDDDPRFPGRMVTYTRAYPKVIMKESETLHLTAVEPTMILLQRPHFRNANSEYLAALEDYRKGDFSDCLTKCASAFESVLKVVCDRKKWSYQHTDTASTLVRTILAKTTLGAYFEPLFLIVPTLRNKLGSAHGAGTATKLPPRHIALYALNATASAILLVAQEAGEA